MRVNARFTCPKEPKLFLESRFLQAVEVYIPTMEPSVDDFLCASHSDFVTLGMSTCIAGGTLRADY